MAYMHWTQDLETGIHVIDLQHRRIIDYINELDQASRTGGAGEAGRVLVALVDYTVTHFQFEEELQERAQYPFLKAHKRVHEIFKKRIAGFLERANAGEDVIPELLALLGNWLITHIKGDDRDYVDTVATIVGTTNPANAGGLASTVQRLLGAQASASGTRT